MSDRLVALPGGIGTLDKVTNALAAAVLHHHGKPIGLVDVGGYWRPLRHLLEHMAEAGYLDSVQIDLIVWDLDPVHLLETLLRRPRCADAHSLFGRSLPAAWARLPGNPIWSPIHPPTRPPRATSSYLALLPAAYHTPIVLARLVGKER